MNILKIAFFSIIFLASLATIYFLNNYKEELEITINELNSTSRNNTKLTENKENLEADNEGLETSIADIKADDKSTLNKVANLEVEINGTTSELNALIAKGKKEQPEAEEVLNKLALYSENNSKISKLKKYFSQIKDLNEELQEAQANIVAATAINQSLMAVNNTNKTIINLFKTSTVQDNFKAKVTDILPDWKIVLLDAGFHEDRLSPDTKLTVIRGDKKIADLVVSRVTKDKAVASVEKYYTVVNELGEEEETSISIGDRVIGGQSKDAA